jgi:hypothetical protein
MSEVRQSEVVSIVVECDRCKRVRTTALAWRSTATGQDALDADQRTAEALLLTATDCQSCCVGSVL